MKNKFILMVWDCKFCSRKGIPGNVRTCPGCGNPCGNNVKYYIPGQKMYVNHSEVPDGADWQCDYCKSYNRCYDDTCRNCGASKDGTQDYFGQNVKASENSSSDDLYENEIDDDYLTNENFSIDNDINKNSKETINEDKAETNYQQTDRTTFGYIKNSIKKILASINTKQMLITVLSIFSVLAVLAGLVYAFVPKERELIVTGISWQYEVDIEQYKTVSESDWFLPSNGRLKHTAQEIRSYTKVLDGYRTETYTEQEIDHYEENVSYRDCGNGYAEEIRSSYPVYRTVTKTREVPVYRDVPVYDTKYYYDIDKYVFNRTETTQGSDKYPFWPENLPIEKESPTIGDERISSQRETYMIFAYMSGKDVRDQKEYTMNLEEWKAINVGDSVRCKIYITGKIELIEP